MMPIIPTIAGCFFVSGAAGLNDVFEENDE
jgi:hypothetical protein